jgi:hypothetical protein
MSITQTYYLAHKARAKLSNEAARSDHNLRLLVGHANLLDSLMIELADAEREQESWFNQSVRGAAESQPQPQVVPIQVHQHYSEDEDDWAVESDSDDDSVLDDDSDDSSSEDAEYEAEAEDDDEDDDEDIVMADVISVRKIPQQLTRVPSRQRRTPLPEVFEPIVEEDEEDEDFAGLGLARIPSHASPPELDHDSDTSEDEAMPPSPPQDMLTFPDTAKDLDDVHRDLADGAAPEDNSKAFYADGYYVPAKNPARLLPTFAGVY